MITSKLKTQLKKLRSKYDMTQADLASLVNVSQQAIARWETDKATPDPDMLLQLASVLNVTVDELLRDDASTGNKIPILLAAVTAPAPIADALGYETISAELAASGDYYALLINDDSMSPFLLPGDIVIVRIQSDYESGDVITAIVNGETLVKRIRKTNDGIILYAYNNAAYQPHAYRNDEMNDVQIVGKVIEVRRSL